MSHTPVITISSRTPDPIREPYFQFPAFLASCKRQGIEPHFLNEGKYCGLMSKPRFLKSYLDREGAKFEHIIVLDSWDTLLLCGADEILYNWRGFGKPIVFNAERSHFPGIGLADKFPEAPTPYKFLNSGFLVGGTAAVMSMLECMEKTWGFPDDVHNPDGTWMARNDQQDYSLYFLDHQDTVRLDTTAILCQSLHNAEPNEFAFLPDKGRVISLLTKNQPCVVHGNGTGKEWLKRIIGWLQL